MARIILELADEAGADEVFDRLYEEWESGRLQMQLGYNAAESIISDVKQED